jgi:L-fuconolactonase
MISTPIIDTHLHLWDPARLSYPWLSDVPTLNRPHLLEDYRQATAGLPIEKMVFMQCEADFAAYRQEVDWVSEQARLDPRLRGIVAWAPLEHGEAARDALAALKTNPLLRGIRRIIQFETDPGFCLRPEFVRGVQLVADFDLHFEICIKGDEQWANTLTLVRRCPQTRFMLDHIGKPFIKDKRLQPWSRHLRELAALPNTWCKLSGLANEADWAAWQPADFRPYLDHALECFGVGRVMFGGDWPVCTLATPYRRWAETLGQALSGLTDRERCLVFHDNAEKFYRI